AVSFLIGCGIATAFGFAIIDAVCIGLALMFSSTILTVKLLPTTNLHHGKMGAACIGVLILQDLIAIGVLAFIRCLAGGDGVLLHFTLLNIKLAFFFIVLILVEQFILRKILWQIERLHEAVFILGLAWCFGVALISNSLGLFYETGAFFAGVAMARHPIALYIYENFKPIRDFFLVLFFFTLGTRLNMEILPEIFWPTAVLAIVFMLVKPWLFRKFFIMTGEKKEFSTEAGL
ncbi:MAG: sodium:proton antiporter, partial [Candidatus Omnitrophica bacterium CG12_big_fil_rev_8_21_14_0_65_50_5]